MCKACNVLYCTAVLSTICLPAVQDPEHQLQKFSATSAEACCPSPVLAACAQLHLNICTGRDSCHQSSHVAIRRCMRPVTGLKPCRAIIASRDAGMG